MRTYITLLFLWVSSSAYAATYTVGTSGTYTTLKDAFDAINAGSITGSITLQVISSTTETATASINANGSGAASYTDVTIYPTGSGYTISGNHGDAPIIYLNGADNVTIDGRVNATGSTKDLTIDNLASGTNVYTILLIESSQNNTFQYCKLKNSGNKAILLFSTSSSGTGNSNNTISNCDFSKSHYSTENFIYSYGTVGRENSTNLITNSNFFLEGNLELFVAILISLNSESFTISGNSFYTNGFRTNEGSIISMEGGSGHMISGNYIGGTSPNCGGAGFNINGIGGNYFRGIRILVNATVENNIIQNFASNAKASDANRFWGIEIVSGTVTVENNLIGSLTTASSILLSDIPCIFRICWYNILWCRNCKYS